jgi:PrtD family type I secretion system ABC transporter
MTDQRLSGFVADTRQAIVSVAAFSLFSSLLMLVIPLFTLQVLDRVLTTRSFDTLIVLAIGAMLVLVLMALLYQLRERIMARVAVMVDDRLGPMVFRLLLQRSALLGLPEQNRLLRDVHYLRSFLVSAGFFTFFELMLVPVFVGLLFIFNVTLASLVLGAVILIALAGLIIEWTARPTLQLAYDRYRKGIAHEDIFLRNAETIEAMGMSSQIEQLWRRQQAAGHQLDLKAADRVAQVNAFIHWTKAILNIAVMTVGAWLAIEGRITTGALILCVIIGMRAIAPMESLVRSFRGISQFRAASRRLQQYLASAIDVRANHAITALPQGPLTVENLVYVPPGGRQPVLKGLSFKLQQGQVLGITGQNGSGKSTLLKAIMGIYRPGQGSVRLGDLEVSQLNRELFGYHIGYLRQDAELFAGSVADNISRLQPAALDEVVAAARFAGAHDLIQRLPDGYSTHVVDGGINLSGGQRQMIALARACFGTPGLLILDEPTAMLDLHETEHVAQMIGRLRESGITTVLVTHQRRLLQEVNQVLVLRDGKIDSLQATKVGN